MGLAWHWLGMREAIFAGGIAKSVVTLLDSDHFVILIVVELSFTRGVTINSPRSTHSPQGPSGLASRPQTLLQLEHMLPRLAEKSTSVLHLESLSHMTLVTYFSLVFGNLLVLKQYVEFASSADLIPVHEFETGGTMRA